MLPPVKALFEIPGCNTVASVILPYIPYYNRILVTGVLIRSKHADTNEAPWRNGSASDSRSEGCVFKSRRGHLIQRRVVK